MEDSVGFCYFLAKSKGMDSGNLDPRIREDDRKMEHESLHRIKTFSLEDIDREIQDTEDIETYESEGHEAR